MSTERFDDQPQWYWGAASSVSEEKGFERADDRFVVASGQRELWSRVGAEVDRNEKCAWMPFGPKDGQATLADCMAVFLPAREGYGVSYNRLVLELAQVPAFARFIHKSHLNLVDFVSNPLTDAPLPREPYDRKMIERLGSRITATLHLEDDEWWREQL